MPAPIDISGKRFGRLIALRSDGNIGRDRAWLCRCDCGNETRVRTSSLQKANTTSCGCLRLERISTHGLCDAPEYAVWKAAKNRCHNPKSQGFARYGERGIRMCDQWRNNFAMFIADMGRRPSPNHSLERKDNNGPYSPENCIWATLAEQSVNKRSNARITFRGETLTKSQWAARVGISTRALDERLRLGWPLEEALTKRPDRSGNRHDSKRYSMNGETLPLPQWARRIGINTCSLRERLDRGWPIERALTAPRTRGHGFSIAKRIE